ncbi:MAG: hypothetical protein JEZ11_20290 [Desulfobacterales bacterium]|nr:hypothetical protein [Desulfobacterales bacterium]
MKPTKLRCHSFSRQVRCVSVLMTAILLLAGCTLPKTYFRQNHSVAWALEAHRFPADYHYYVYGSRGVPIALLGIEKGVGFSPGRYRPVDGAGDTLKRWVDAINDPFANRHEGYGKELVSNGIVVGIWYSDWVVPPVRILEDGRIALDPPSLRISEKWFRPDPL